jgi:hypothetical protein
MKIALLSVSKCSQHLVLKITVNIVLKFELNQVLVAIAAGALAEEKEHVNFVHVNPSLHIHPWRQQIIICCCLFAQ